MKKFKHTGWILILMLVSQAMLTVLIVQWMRLQWREEKSNLYRDINIKFTDCVNQVYDTMIVRHLIEPVLSEHDRKENHLVTFSAKAGPPPFAGKEASVFLKDSLKRSHTSMTISLPDSSQFPRTEEIIVAVNDSSERKMLLRSVKMIVRRTEDTLSKAKSLSHVFMAVPDTSMLRRLVRSKFDPSAEDFNVIWQTDSTKTPGNKMNKTLYFYSNIMENPVSMGVTHYNGVIFRQLLPQFIFALMLLIITGAAFTLAYKSIRKQESLNLIRNDFINNISHELKTPVSTISVALEALKDAGRLNNPEKAAEYIKIASGEMKRLDQLISRVLNTSLLENKSGCINTEKTDLNKLTASILENMKARFDKEEAIVHLNPSAGELFINCDRLNIEGVLLNLIDNSLKYAGRNAEIVISISRKKSNVCLSLYDNGPGIPEEYINKVFDKFFRVPSGDIHNTAGYGLGLSFARMVMTQHSGSISVKNRKEGGCEFLLTFPSA